MAVAANITDRNSLFIEYWRISWKIRAATRLSLQMYGYGRTDIRGCYAVVAQNAFTMPMKEAASRAAPPIRPPSTSGLAKSWGALEGLQLPP